MRERRLEKLRELLRYLVRVASVDVRGGLQAALDVKRLWTEGERGAAAQDGEPVATSRRLGFGNEGILRGCSTPAAS